jgi:hypothetical protein
MDTPSPSCIVCIGFSSYMHQHHVTSQYIDVPPRS